MKKVLYFLFFVFVNFLFADSVSLGVRPSYLINDMDNSALKKELLSCQDKKMTKTDFSIGHRGAAMQFPEHTKEAYLAGAKMGAGILECDVTFTKDKELVCRHSQCDLHTTTNILQTELASKCSEGFTPAKYDKNGKLVSPASAKCCTSDITLKEFKILKGKMDAGNKNAKTVEEYVNSTPSWRTDLYTSRGTLMTHKESIELFKKLNVKMTPEIKIPSVKMPYEGTYTQEDFIQQVIGDYKKAKVSPSNVFVQSFSLDDVKYVINKEPDFGKQAVYLIETENFPANENEFINQIDSLKKAKVNYVAPPLFMLVQAKDGKIVPSNYANALNKANMNIITWTLERSGLLKSGGGWYYQTIKDITNNDGDTYELLDVLAQDVKVKGVFSDWPATVSYYANCKGIK